MVGVPVNATRRAVRDLLAQGVHGQLLGSVVGLELAGHLQSAVTSDVGDGAGPGEILEALGEESAGDALVYARLLELLVIAGLDELQLIAGLSDEISELGDIDDDELVEDLDVERPGTRRPAGRRRGRRRA